MIVVCAVTWALAIWWGLRPPVRPWTQPTAPHAPAWVRWAGMSVGVVSAWFLIAFIGGASALLWSVMVTAIGGTVGFSWHGRQARVRFARARHQVSLGCQSVSGQLSAGQLPSQALLVAADDCPVLARSAATQRIGGDVAAALRRAGAAPGCSGLVSLASAWQLAEASGAPVASLVAAVAEEQREEQRVRALVGTELAAPRATGQLLCGLPLVGIAMGSAVGADPRHFLLETLIGQSCLLAAVVLCCAGVLWTASLSDRAGA